MASTLQNIKRFTVGTMVGIASMLPGVSGAVIAVCFGIYERLIADLADLRHRIKTDFVFILTIALGMLFGMVVSAFGLDYLMNQYMALALFFFLGLILGQIPELWKLTAPKTGRYDAYNKISFIFGIGVMMMFMVLGIADNMETSHDMTSYICLFFVGIIFAISKIAPGISGSTLLLALGLYQPMLDAITSHDWALLVPLCIGLIIGLLGFAKVMNNAITNHRRSTYCAILGLTVGSLVVILDYSMVEITSTMDLVTGLVGLILGIILSLSFIKIGRTSENQT